jgi:hypothetical protein
MIYKINTNKLYRIPIFQIFKFTDMNLKQEKRMPNGRVKQQLLLQVLLANYINIISITQHPLKFL